MNGSWFFTDACMAFPGELRRVRIGIRVHGQGSGRRQRGLDEVAGSVSHRGGEDLDAVGVAEIEGGDDASLEEAAQETHRVACCPPNTHKKHSSKHRRDWE